MCWGEVYLKNKMMERPTINPKGNLEVFCSLVGRGGDLAITKLTPKEF